MNSEQQLRTFIKEVLNRTFNQSIFDDLCSQTTMTYDNTKNVIKDIILNDPSSDKRYSKWMMNEFERSEMSSSTMSKYVQIFDENRDLFDDNIYQFSSLRELIAALKAANLNTEIDQNIFKFPSPEGFAQSVADNIPSGSSNSIRPMAPELIMIKSMEKKERQLSKLTSKKQKAAVKMFTGSTNDDEQNLKEFIDIAMSSNCTCDGTFFRGIRLPENQFLKLSKSGTYNLNEFASVTAVSQVAARFGYSFKQKSSYELGIIFIIQAKNVIPISKLSDYAWQAEGLLVNSTLNIDKIYYDKRIDRWLITCEEV